MAYEMRADLPKVAVIGMGGSIAYTVDDPLRLHAYEDHGRVMSVEDLVRSVPELASIGHIVPVDVQRVDSTAVGPTDWMQVRDAVDDLLARTPDLDGVVITHGTASLEETAYFLDLVLETSTPVALVGAFRPPGGLSSDAPISLVNAVRVVASGQASGLGVLVVSNDRVHAARDVAKHSNHRLDAFISPDYGPLGVVEPNGEVVVRRAPVRAPRPLLTLGGRKRLPRVDIVYSYAGSDGTAIGAFLDAGAEAIVSAGFPPGRASKAEETLLTEARQAGVVWVQASRAGSGRVLTSDRFRSHGVVVADDLSPQKARILAMLGLCVTKDVVELQDLFWRY
jgi:L-asparaginase